MRPTVLGVHDQRAPTFKDRAMPMGCVDAPPAAARRAMGMVGIRGSVAPLAAPGSGSAAASAAAGSGGGVPAPSVPTADASSGTSIDASSSSPLV